MMHVLFLTIGYPTVYNIQSGIFFREQAEALAVAGMRTGLIAINAVSIKHIIRKRSFAGLRKREFNTNGVQTVLTSFINNPVKPDYVVHQALRKGRGLVSAYIEQYGKPDLIHLQCFETVELAQYIKSRWSIPYVVTEHSSRFLLDTLNPGLEKYAASCFQNSDKNIAVSTNFAELLEKRYQAPFLYIPNMVDTEFFTMLKRDHVKPNRFINVGVLDKNKNQALLIEAIARLRDRGRDLGLVIVGEGPERTNLQAMIKQRALENHVKLKGFLGRGALLNELHDSHAFLLSSQFETFGVALIEAMSCGLPAVCTRSPGPESIIAKPGLGILCDNDPDDYVLAVDRLIEEYSSFSPSYIHNYVREYFSKFSVSKKLMDLYKGVIKA